MIFGVIAAIAIIALVDLPGLIRQRKRRELAVYCVCLAAVSVYLILFGLNVEFSSSTEALHRFFENTLGLSYARFR